MGIGIISSTSNVSPFNVTPRNSGFSANGQAYSEEQIKQFVQSNQDSPQVLAQQAASMGLTADQIQQALKIGGVDLARNDVIKYAEQNGYDFDSKNQRLEVAPQISSGIDKGTTPWSPTQNRWIKPNEVKAFLATNPSDKQIFQQANTLGLSLQDLNAALRGQGYTGQALGQHFNRFSFNLYTGGLGYTAMDSGNGAFDGRIVAGGGHTEVDSGRGDGSKVWKTGQASTVAFGSTGQVGSDYNGTNNWSIKDGYIGNGTGVAGDGFAGNGTAVLAATPISTTKSAALSTVIGSIQSTLNLTPKAGSSSDRQQTALADSRTEATASAKIALQRSLIHMQKALAFGGFATKAALGDLLNTKV
nr:hypothetical protein [Rhodoferax sp.]